MKAEINNENKAKFLALYWGQDLVFSNNGKKYGSVNGYQLDTEYCLKQTHLSLKNLSQISDEDAIEIGYDSDIISEHDWFYDFQTDYLRSKGYALPWMGLSVEEMIKAGWIKLNEKV